MLPVFTFLGCCGVCAALKPRYKRLVDNIFPEDPQVTYSYLSKGVKEILKEI